MVESRVMPLGPVVVDLEGLSLTAEDRELLTHPAAGGVVLFTRNYESVQQLVELVAQIHGLRSPSLLVCIDQEGGRVRRLRHDFWPAPAAAAYGEVYDRDPDRGMNLAALGGWLLATELRAVGIDFSFAPVLDLRDDGSAVIGRRAFHTQPSAVAQLGAAFARGMREAGMCAVVKHFPGHGGVVSDSHHCLPEDPRDFRELQRSGLAPFVDLFKEGAKAVMTAHICFPRFDPLPVTFSAKWLQECLRSELGFAGVVFSDDLTMGALDHVADLSTRAQMALEAGCDMVLVCNNRNAAIAVVEVVGDGGGVPLAQHLAGAPGGSDNGMSTWRALKENERYRRTEAALAELVETES